MPCSLFSLSCWSISYISICFWFMESFCICIKERFWKKASHKTIITTPNFIFLRTTVVQQKTEMRLQVKIKSHCQLTSSSPSSSSSSASSSWGISGKCKPPSKFCMASRRLLTEDRKSHWPPSGPAGPPAAAALNKEKLKIFSDKKNGKSYPASGMSLGLKLGSSERKNIPRTLGSSKFGRPSWERW